MKVEIVGYSKEFEKKKVKTQKSLSQQACTGK